MSISCYNGVIAIYQESQTLISVTNSLWRYEIMDNSFCLKNHIGQIHHRHHRPLNVLFSIIDHELDGCFQQHWVDNQPLVTLSFTRVISISHHQAVVYPWEFWCYDPTDEGTFFRPHALAHAPSGMGSFYRDTISNSTNKLKC